MPIIISTNSCRLFLLKKKTPRTMRKLAKACKKKERWRKNQETRLIAHEAHTYPKATRNRMAGKTSGQICRNLLHGPRSVVKGKNCRATRATWVEGEVENPVRQSRRKLSRSRNEFHMDQGSKEPTPRPYCKKSMLR